MFFKHTIQKKMQQFTFLKHQIKNLVLYCKYGCQDFSESELQKMFYKKRGSYPGDHWEWFKNVTGDEYVEVKKKGYLILSGAYNSQGEHISMVSAWRPKFNPGNEWVWHANVSNPDFCKMYKDKGYLIVGNLYNSEGRNLTVSVWRPINDPGDEELPHLPLSTNHIMYRIQQRDKEAKRFFKGIIDNYSQSFVERTF